MGKGLGLGMVACGTSTAVGVDMMGHLRPKEMLTKGGKCLGHPKMSTAIMSLFNEEMANGRSWDAQLAGPIQISIIHKEGVTLPMLKATQIDRTEIWVFLIKKFNESKPKQ